VEVKQISLQVQPNIEFYEGISLIEYKKLEALWNEIIQIVRKEIYEYVNDDNLCFDDINSFPTRSKLTGNYYIDNVSYIKHVNPVGFQIMVFARLTEYITGGEDDYLGLEVTLFTKDVNESFEVWGIDSSSI
jgi:hypothetical protein